MRALGAAWKTASDETKEEYNEQAAMAKAENDDKRSVKSGVKSFESMTLKELKAECKKKNLKISGKKTNLIERLENPLKYVKKRAVPKDSDSESELESGSD